MFSDVFADLVSLLGSARTCKSRGKSQTGAKKIKIVPSPVSGTQPFAMSTILQSPNVEKINSNAGFACSQFLTEKIIQSPVQNCPGESFIYV